MERRVLSEPGGTAQAVWASVAVAATAGIAGYGAWPVYASMRVALVVGVGVAIGIGTVWLGRALGWRWWAILATGAFAYVLTAVPVAIPTAMTSPGRTLRAVAEALVGIVTSWKRLLTVELPAGEYQAVLIPLFITIVAGTVAAMLLATSGTRAAPLAAVPMLAMVAFGPFFGTANTSGPWELGPATIAAPRQTAIAFTALVVTAAWLLGRSRIERQAAVRLARLRASTVRQSSESALLALRRNVVGALLVTAAVGAGVAAAPVADRLDAREAVRNDIQPMLVLERQPSPLSSFRANLEGAAYDEVLFTISGASVDRVRIATLDTFDGQTFHVIGDSASIRFTRQPELQSSEVTITIGAGYTGVWVPVVSADAGTPVFTGSRAEELGDAYYASAELNAAIVVTNGADAGIGLVEGDSYRLSATTSEGDPERFGSAQGTDPLINADLYPNLVAWVDAQERGRSGADLLKLVELLGDRGYLSHSDADDDDAQAWSDALPGYTFEPSRSGHSAARIEGLFGDLLDQQRRAGADPDAALLVGAVGDEEQFATAAALLARYLGFESRVVVGVRTSDDGSGLPFCTDTCTGADVTAWAEARTSGGDWVILDATPQFTMEPTALELGTELPENPTQVNEPASDVLDPPALQADSTTKSDIDEEDPIPEEESFGRLASMIGAGALGSFFIFLPLMVFPAAKGIRRAWRRRSSSPEVQVVGAWAELIDTYTDHGIDVPQFLTRAETADVLERPAAVDLAALVDRAVFSEHPPSPDMAQAAWTIAAAERRAVRRSVGLRTRMRAGFTTQSFTRAIKHDKGVAPHLAGGVHHGG